MAMAMPPMLIVLMVRPMSFKTMTVMSNESGMVAREMSVVRPFMRKMKSTSTTKMPPSMSDLRMFEIEASMNFCWR